MLVEQPDGTVKHEGPGACGRVWAGGGGLSAWDRAMRCPDLNDEMLSQVVAAPERVTAGLGALAEEYEAALVASVADRAALRESAQALTGRVTALEARIPVLQYQVKAVPAVTVLQATVDVPVSWPAPFADANYTVVPPSVTTTGVTLLGKVGAVVKSKTATGVVVTVTTSALLTAGAAQVHVLAYRVGG